jgi:gluconate 2-dehydrogenase gamma chain
MDRRKSLKIIAGTAIASGAALAGCNPGTEKTETPVVAKSEFTIDRNPDELKHEQEIQSKEKFFTEHEMATITVLADIIIPKDEVSGSASEAKVPEFIEYIVKDMPQHQTPLRGGLRWLDLQCLKKFEKSFVDCSSSQQIEMVDQIAYPAKAIPEMQQGVVFFNLVRNLTATGFYTSEMGIKDIGYAGSTPNQWNGVPQDVLDQYKVAYTEKELKECISF